jgi:hypothetical protein
MSKRPPRHSLGNYTVGKGRPPTATRWKPGQSGNPKGRPKGTRNAATMAKAELARKVVVNLNGVKRKMSVAEIAFRRLGDRGRHQGLQLPLNAPRQCRAGRYSHRWRHLRTRQADH